MAGDYALDGDTLTVCDNAPNLDKGRPAAFEATRGSGYVRITFTRAKPERQLYRLAGSGPGATPSSASRADPSTAPGRDRHSGGWEYVARRGGPGR